jgi:phosphatidylserine decarboxylase
MAKTLKEWINSDVSKVRDKPMKWLSEEHFFRDPNRPLFADEAYFFAPADGVILYADIVEADESIVDIKGKAYSLQDAMRKSDY